MRRSVPLEIAYRLIGSGPVVLVSSISGGKSGLTPIAWHMPVSDDPPIVALEIWEKHFIYKAILETGDFVINIPSSAMVDTIRGLGSISGAKADKFAEFGLVKEKARKVKSPRLGSAIGVLECKLRKEKALLKKYNIVLGDVVYAEADGSLFSDRWLPEKKGPRVLHHLGGRIFYAPEKKVI
ncbi:MAG: flavin reductase family protein [Candidatus Omnitrophica bacterium]|nr:flavin reductase family protein [Candidatus Omnitrophota bacterium]MDD5437054.1 flavin reductase family protein [Candidatus Omnitrophota bacterium]